MYFLSQKVDVDYCRVGVSFASMFVRKLVYEKIKFFKSYETRLCESLCDFIRNKAREVNKPRHKLFDCIMDAWFEDVCAFELVCKGKKSFILFK